MGLGFGVYEFFFSAQGFGGHEGLVFRVEEGLLRACSEAFKGVYGPTVGV